MNEERGMMGKEINKASLLQRAVMKMKKELRANKFELIKTIDLKDSKMRTKALNELSQEQKTYFKSGFNTALLLAMQIVEANCNMEALVEQS